jgi:predicted alpha/beta-fold hydrolase
MTLKLMGEEGLPEKVLGAVAVSGSIDLNATNMFMKTLMWPRRIYSVLTLRGSAQRILKYGFRLRPIQSDSSEKKANDAGIKVNVSKDERLRIRRSNTLYQFDRDFFARFSGFNDREHYYSKASAVSYARNVEKPTLVIHAANDPFVPIEPCGYLPGRHFDLRPGNRNYPRISATNGTDKLLVITTSDGGHVGFWPRRRIFSRANPAWHDMVAGDFFDAVRQSRIERFVEDCAELSATVDAKAGVEPRVV